MVDMKNFCREIKIESKFAFVPHTLHFTFLKLNITGGKILFGKLTIVNRI